MIMSMTGYGNDTFHIEDTSITVEIRSVNSRYLDFIPKIPRSLHYLEADIKQIIQQQFTRGRIEVYISMNGNYLVNKHVYVDWNLMDQFVAQLREANSKYGLQDKVSLSVLTSIEDLFSIQEEKVEDEKLKPLLLESIERATDQVARSRQREGAFLLADIQKRIKTLKNMLESIEERKEVIYTEYRERIKYRIEQHIGETIEIDEHLLVQEIALLAEKGDIAEEITRLHSHLHHFQTIVEKENAIGRKLDFITQEMHREVNTIGSKSVDSKISEWIVTMKSEIDKIKEQIQNIE